MILRTVSHADSASPSTGALSTGRSEHRNVEQRVRVDFDLDGISQLKQQPHTYYQPHTIYCQHAIKDTNIENQQHTR